MNDARPLALCILAALRGSPKPLKRRELADRCGPHGCKVSTAERRIREALDHLVMVLRIPVMNEGAGYFIASNPAQFEKGLRLLEKTVNAEAQKIKTLRRMKSRMQYPAQSAAQSLPFEAASWACAPTSPTRTRGCPAPGGSLKTPRPPGHSWPALRAGTPCPSVNRDATTAWTGKRSCIAMRPWCIPP